MSGDCREANRVVRQHRVDALRAVHDLRHAEIDDHTRERERLPLLEAVLASHERRAFRRSPGQPLRRDPRRSRMSSHPSGVHAIGHSTARDRLAPKASAELARSAPRSRAARPHRHPAQHARRLPTEARRADGIGRKSTVPAMSSLQSMFPPHGRGGAVECTPGSSGGMPMHAEERARARPRGRAGRDRSPASASSCQSSYGRLAVVDTETLVQRRDPATCLGDAPPADPDLVDPDLEDLPGPSATYLDRSDERMSGVELVALGSPLEDGSLDSASRQPACRQENAIESPGSTESTGSRSREKCPCSVRRSSGISWSVKPPEGDGRRRRRARPTACTRPRSASTGTARRTR